MKKIIKLFSLVLLLTVTLFGCNNNKTPKEVIVTALHESISIKDIEVENYDYTSLFTITTDGNDTKVQKEYLKNTVKKEAGTYTVICEYEGKVATTIVVVVATESTVTASQDSVEIKKSQVLNYDFKALFDARVDGTKITITDDMVTTDIKAEIGTYNYTVTVGKTSKTITVKVIEDHYVDIVKSYELLNIEKSKVNDFDFTTLFTIYSDGAILKLTKDMLDLSELSNPVVGETYNVSLTYEKSSSTVKIKIVDDEQIIVNTKNIVTYPNSETIDLTTLFEIKKGNTIIPVTIDMITGHINYTISGNNEITLTYDGNTYAANVEVKQGVVINYANSNHVTIEKGTKKSEYVFSDDFIVIVNGIRFNLIPEKYLDLSTVDFNTVGTYEVKISIPYINRLTLSSVKFDYIEKTIIYDVQDTVYDLTIKEEEVKIPYGTTSYNPVNNLNLKVNNIRMNFADEPENASIMDCYYKITSNPIDLTKVGLYEVVIELYVYGADKEPVIAKFNVMIESNAKITVNDKVIFTNELIYTKDLFTLEINNEIVEIDQSLISGKVDTFTPGLYEITLNYQGIIKTAKVVVLDNAITGTYITDMTTIPTTDVDSSDETVTIPGRPLGNMEFTDFNNFTVNNQNASVVSVIDEKTIIVKIGSNKYTMYYDQGIVVFDPDNTNKMSFSDYRRPLVYFSQEKYDLLYKFDINYGNSHVLENTYSSYSIDTFQYQDKETKETKWFGLKVWLTSKTSADTIYEVSWGEVIYPENFEMQTDVVGTISFNGEYYDITVLNRFTAKVVKEEIDRTLYAKMTFTGKINGQNATINFDQYSGMTITIGNTKFESYGSYDYNQMKYGGFNKITNEAYCYICNNEQVQSIKLKMDVETKTFTYIEKDKYFGKYESENAYIFLDGYGQGLINFNKSSYYVTTFTYKVNSGVLTANFTNLTVENDHGTSIELYLSDFLNRLTVKDCKDKELKGVKFDNTIISDGALINIKDYIIGADNDTIAKPNFLKNIEIITKDGIVSDSEKTSYIDLTKVSFSTPGFYHYTITIKIDGKKVSQIYPLQVLEAIYDKNELVATYGNGIFYHDNTLMIDKYGRGILHTKDASFTGTVVITNDEFAMKAYNDNGASIRINGKLIADGIMAVSCTGAVYFTDYFTTATHRSTGIKNFILHEFNYNNTRTYILGKSSSDIGEKVTVENLNGTTITIGSIIKINTTDEEYIIKLLSWDSQTEGITFADEYRGTYSLETQPDLTIDGFDQATYGELTGTYTINNNIINFVSGNTVKVFKLNKDQATYEIINVTLDNTLVEGNTFTGTHKFSCGDFSYDATTSFKFEADGKVLIKSSSSSHDDGDYSCGDDIYNPPYAKKEGTYGTYSVNGNKLTIIVGEYKFEFVMTDVTNVSTIKCSFTNLDSEAHGYFKTETVFTK